MGVDLSGDELDSVLDGWLLQCWPELMKKRKSQSI
jgi:hypothetical protein